ncbi:MAG: slipin family protein [Desulfobacterales bacterium]|nr:slipin family protein [Desulfobacterales bacterium]
MIRRKTIRSYEKGLYFKNREFKGILEKGRHWFADPFFNARIDIASMRDPWLIHDNLDVMIKSGLLDNHVQVIDLEDYQRALVWIEGRFAKILGPGLYALWKDFKKLRVEIIDAREVRFTHEAAARIAKNEDAACFFSVVDVPESHKCVYFKDGKYVETLPAGRHLFWTGTAVNRFFTVDLREKILDVSGQEIMTSDKVTLRINAMLSFGITDAVKSVSLSEDSRQALYREAQLALRSVIGALALDSVLNEKENVSNDLISAVQNSAQSLGIQVKSFGIRDIILPGDMKDLMNKVIEAKKAAESNLIMRREETAAMRSQANTAKLLDNNPTLMRLRELDLLEKVVSNSKMNVVLGEKGLTDRVVNLL